MEDVMALATIDPEFEEVLAKEGNGPTMKGDVTHMRAMLDAAKRRMVEVQSDGLEGVNKNDITIKARDGFEIPARIYKPTSPPSDGSPLAVVFHGGGFVLGSLDGEELICRLFTQKFGCVCINVAYRLAPEYPYPAAPNDAWDSVKWAASNASSLGATPSKGFVLVGTSAGGNLADVCGHLARDEKLSPPLTGLLEMVPALIPREVIPEKYVPEYLSWEQNKDAPHLGRTECEWFMSMYNPDINSHLYASFNNPNGHAGLPPVYFQVCGLDPLRDDALIYERVLREEAGVKTKMEIYTGLPHGFWSRWPDMKASKRFVGDTVKGMEWLLAQV